MNTIRNAWILIVTLLTGKAPKEKAEFDVNGFRFRIGNDTGLSGTTDRASVCFAVFEDAFWTAVGQTLQDRCLRRLPTPDEAASYPEEAAKILIDLERNLRRLQGKGVWNDERLIDSLVRHFEGVAVFLRQAHESELTYELDKDVL